jgi:RNA polymerase sigma-70 factor (ECF subfamily)
LYAEHVGRVHATCLRISADPVRARELTQDVFVRAWEKLGTFRGESLFSSWLYRLAVNVVIEDQRKRTRAGRRLEVPLEIRHIEGSPGPGADPGLGVDLDRAVARLPEGARTVLVLHAIEGYRYEEVAEMTGLALGTVKAQIHRARKLLRDALQ